MLLFQGTKHVGQRGYTGSGPVRDGFGCVLDLLLYLRNLAFQRCPFRSTVFDGRPALLVDPVSQVSQVRS
ncbi:MAG: hypothetical protein ABJQ21_06160 [Roseibium sp.]